MVKQKTNFVHPVDKYVGAKLRERRLLLGISQEQLASYVDLTFQQIQKYEKGLNRISCSKLFQFAKFLKSDISYFFLGLQNDSKNLYGEISEDNNEIEAFDNADSTYGQKPIKRGRISNQVREELLRNSNDMDILISSFSSIKDQGTKDHILSLVQSLSKKK